MKDPRIPGSACPYRLDHREFGAGDFLRSARVLIWVYLSLLFALSAVTVEAQEVVVFKDKRAEVISGHRVEGAWTYLTVAEGEIGVPSDQIFQFRPATPEEIASRRPAQIESLESDALHPRPESSCSSDREQPKSPTPKLKDLSVKKVGSQGLGEKGRGNLRAPTGKLSKEAKKNL